LANSCPFINAEAVFGARSILSATKQLEFDDAAICNAVGISFKTEEVKPKSKEETEKAFDFIAKLYPNPTGYYTTMYINKILSDNNKIIIMDASGKTVLNDKFIDLKYNINTEAYSTGVYHISIFENDIIINTTSLQIHR
jgi:hypothetical protein